jgi:PAS domain S-box-containing protein
MPSNSQDPHLAGDEDSAASVKQEQPIARSNEIQPLQQPIADLLSDRAFAALFAATSDAIAIADESGCYVAVNPATCELAGLAAEDLIGRSLGEFTPPQFDFESAWQALQQQTHKQGVFSLIRSDGHVRNVKYTVTANFIPHYHLVVLRDITEQKQLERQIQDLIHERECQLKSALEASQQKYQTLFKILPVGVSITDAEGNIIEANPASETILGISVEDHTKRTYNEPTWRIIGPDHRIMPASDYASVRALQDHRVIRSQEQGIIHDDGSIRWITVSAAPIPLDDYGVAIAYTDITERKRLEQILADSKEELTDLLNSSGAIITKFSLLADGSCNYDYYSPQSEVIYGYQPEELLNNPNLWRSRVLPEDFENIILPAIQSIFTGQRQLDLEYRFRHRDGSIRWIHETATARRDEAKDCWSVIVVATDISDRVSAEIALRDSEERLRFALEAARMGSWDWNILTNKVVWSESLERLMGMQPGSFDGCFETFRAIVYPDDRPRVFDAIARSIEQDESYDIEFRFIRPDGSIRWASSQGNVLRDRDGRAIRMIGVDIDITERKQAELSLQQALQELTHHVENSPLATIRWNQEFRVESWSEQAERIFGWTAEEVAGKTMYDWQFIFEEDLKPVHQTATQLLQGINSVNHNRNYHKNGSVLYCEWYNSTLLDEQGNLISILSVVQDVSDRTAAEIALQQSEARYRILSEISPVAIFRFEQAFNCVYVNDRWSEMTGRSKASALGRGWIEALHPDERDLVLSRWAEQYAQSDPRNFTLKPSEGRHLRPDGSITWYYAQITPEIDATGQVSSYVGTLTDITALKQTEQELECTRNFLQQVLDYLPLAVFTKDAATLAFTLWNNACTELLGYQPEQVLGKTDYDLFPPEQARRCIDQDREAIQSRRIVDIPEETIVGNAGQPLIVHNRKVAVYDTDNQPQLVIGIVEDITALKQAENALLQKAEQERSLRLIAQHIRATLDLDAILSTAVAEIQQTLNADRTLIFRLNSDHSGVVIQEAVRPEYPVTLAMRWEDECFPPECYASYCQGKARIVSEIAGDSWGDCLVEFMQQTGVQSKMVAPIVQRQDKGDARVWGLLITHACATPRQWQNDELDLLQQVAEQLAIAIQQSELHQQLQKANRALERLSNTDALTQIANRRCFNDTLATEWRRAYRDGRELALILCDIDYFKQYNDTYGHPAGDSA